MGLSGVGGCQRHPLQSQDWINEDHLRNTECDKGQRVRGDGNCSWLGKSPWLRALRGFSLSLSLFPKTLPVKDTESRVLEKRSQPLCSMGPDVFATAEGSACQGGLRIEKSLPPPTAVWIPGKPGWFTTASRHPNQTFLVSSCSDSVSKQ